MDPNRHDGFIGNSEDPSIPIYYNKKNDDITHSQQIYPKATSLNTKCLCTAIAGNGMCNICRNQRSDIKWKINQYGPSVEYGSKDVKSCQQESSMYVHQSHHHRSYVNKGIDDSVSKPYWTINKQNHAEELAMTNKIMVATHLEAVQKPKSNKYPNYPLENANFHYGQHQPQPQQHQQQKQSCLMPTEIYCKDHCSYEEKYRLKDEPCRSSKVDFLPLANNNGSMYNIGNQNSIKIEAARTSTHDQQIVNPSNMMSSKEQQPSPNYARKCPQIFSNVDHNSCHSNLYVSPPQFSSEKFTNINTQQKAFRESPIPEYRTYENTTSHALHIHSEKMQNRESPLQTSSPIMTFGPSQSNFPSSMVSDPTPSRRTQQHYSYASSPVRNTNYYVPSISKVASPEISPIILKQTQTPHQYSKCILPPPSLHLMQQKPMQRIIEECVKKEMDPYDLQSSSNRNLYINPFNTGVKSDACCSKQSTSTFTPKPQPLCKDEPSNSCHKYNKCSIISMPSNKPRNEIVKTPQQNHSSAYSRPNYYYENQSLRYENNGNNISSSPAVASTAASPLPATSLTHTPIHHSMYAQPQQERHHMQNLDQYQQQPQTTDRVDMQSSKRHEFHAGGSGIDPQDAPSIRPRINTINKGVQSDINIQTAPSHQASQSTKKSQATKPNYRELINHVYAMRNSTSEEELNLQIIKKTLNVDAHIVRAPVAAQIPAQMTVQNEKHPYIPSKQYSSKEENSVNTNASNRLSSEIYLHKRTNLVADVTPTVGPKALENTFPQQIKQEKNIPFSPLDLSMRTVKTKADSTEYSKKSYDAFLNSPSSDCKYTLPRVDFTPNFSLHTKLSSSNSVRNVQPKQTDKRQQNLQTNPNIDNDMFNQAGQAAMQRSAATCLPTSNIACYERQPKVSVEPYHRVPSCANIVHVDSPSTNEPVPIDLLKTKVGSRSNGPPKVFQARPSVLEANPYAQPKMQSLKQHKEAINTISVVDKLPPDTSIMVVPILNPGDAPPTTQIVENELKPKTAYKLACERNPNFLGRKRHLHEYNTNARYIDQPFNKQPRLEEQNSIIIAISPDSNQVLNDHVNEQPRVVDQILSTNAAAVNDGAVGKNLFQCKQEPAAPTTETAPTIPTTIKSETTSIIASRIRTKAELKGFTFNSLPKENICFKEVKIKVEPVTPSSDQFEVPSIPDLVDERSQNSLIDFNWSTTCNDFMEQLLASNKKRANKKKSGQLTPKLEKNSDDHMQSTAVGMRKSSESVIVINDVVQSINEDLHDCSMSPVDSTAAAPKEITGRTEANDSAMTLKSISQESAYQPTVIQKKMSKVEREKMRSQQEKRLAARLLNESSSESENEVNKRLTERLKKPLKRGKARGITSDKKRFSDCGSDSSDTDDQGEEKGSLLKSTKQQRTSDAIEVKEKHKEQKLSESNNNEIRNTNKPNVIVESKSENQNKFKEESNQPILSRNKYDVNSDESEKIEKNEKEYKATKLSEEIENKECPRDVDSDKKVQYGNSISKDNNIFSKQIRKPKLHSKMIGLNTMTRSKRKRELEMQLANSKVLRNDKIIRNSTTKIKRKYVKKFTNNMKQTNGSKERMEEEEIMSTRLRSKNQKQLANNHTLNNTKRAYNKKKHEGTLNKEQQTDLFLEVYRYKRSLKIPASLISIKHPSTQRMSSSLPDLEKNLEEPSSSCIARKPKVVIKKHHAKKSHHKDDHNKESLKKFSDTPSKTAATQYQEPKSIIDLLHSRVINSSSIRPSKVKSIKANTSTSSIHTLSETSQTTESNSIGLGELLPTPKKPENPETTSADGKKRHFSIFDTKVLQTKTRTESKLQQKKEIIREIFVGDDRPASAPPEMTQVPDGGEKMTYEQKYEQFLQQMNIVINEEKLLKFGKATTSISTTSSLVLKDKDDPLKVVIKEEVVDEKLDSEQDKHDSLSTVTGPSNCFRRRRPAKYLRRKGSSGFDYIRKKKKPTHSAATGGNNSLLHPIIKPERTDEYEYGKTKTENDVCREIQKWVLNKGVGQSTMHKAARLGYIDVIVYCLDRMGLNPDQKDNAGYTPLHEACTNGWIEIARILLQYGANHSEAAHSGIRPLHEASENDNLEIVRMLLAYGADPLLATYSGQTPLMLAASNSMKELIKEHLNDVQACGNHRKPWRFKGPWEIFDETEHGFNILGGAPSPCNSNKDLRKSFMSNKKLCRKLSGENSKQSLSNSCAVILDNIDHFSSVRLHSESIKTDIKAATSLDKSQLLIENSDSDGEIFEFEEADELLPPLYLLKDEGVDKWVLLSDLCNLLKVKSKDTLLNKIYPSASISSAHKSLMRELKMSDFLEKATCLQLLCAGEKLNICASKVVLIKYNDNVRNLLGVKTILMKF